MSLMTPDDFILANTKEDISEGCCSNTISSQQLKLNELSAKFELKHVNTARVAHNNSSPSCSSHDEIDSKDMVYVARLNKKCKGKKQSAELVFKLDAERLSSTSLYFIPQHLKTPDKQMPIGNNI